MRERAQVAHWVMQAVARALLVAAAAGAIAAAVGAVVDSGVWYALVIPAALLGAGVTLWGVDLPNR